MAEQPARLAALVTREPEVRAHVSAVLPEPLLGVVLVARGSSDHVGVGARYLLEMASGRPVAMGSPSVLLRYGARLDFTGLLVVGVSQSGGTPEVAAYVAGARAAGARTLAVTNTPASALAGAAERTLALGAGPERAVPATKTVTTEFLALAMVAAAIGTVPFISADLTALPAAVARVLDDPAGVAPAVEALLARPRMLCVARGHLLGAALETGLKIEETTSRPVTCHSAADLHHGPIAIAGPQLTALTLAVPGPAGDDVAAAEEALVARGARVVGLGPGRSAGWAPGVPEALAPVPAIVRGQQIALAMARALGRDPDRPEGLSKVTLR